MNFEDGIGNTVHHSLNPVEENRPVWCLLTTQEVTILTKNYFNLLCSGTLLIQDPSMFVT